MFWNDPMLYGATLPMRDVPVHNLAGVFPQQNIPRFIPQNVGYLPAMPYIHNVYGAPFMGQLPQPFVQLHQPFMQLPQIPQIQQIPQMGFNPLMRPIELNQPFLGWKGHFGQLGL